VFIQTDFSCGHVGQSIAKTWVHSIDFSRQTWPRGIAAGMVRTGFNASDVGLGLRVGDRFDAVG
jgi:hypothetical protein